MTTRSKIAIASILIVSMSASAVLVESEEYEAPPAPEQVEPEPNTVVPQCNAGIIVGAMIIAIGVVIAVGLRKLCKRIDQANPPPAPPPPPPPKLSTNCLMAASAELLPAGSLQLSLFTGTNETAFKDVMYLGYYDPQGYQYSAYAAQRLESSTDLREWQTVITFTQWVSDANILLICGDSNNIPISTNLIPTVSGAFTNALPVEAIRFDQPMQFYRMAEQ